ncbi:MAG TPA: acyl-CoA dehydrogenase family protein [Streptosporangiaceae bacterium]|nr:acyl-CoA dehydrogenase family protein [Streptosporangiaceae bacterium]
MDFSVTQAQEELSALGRQILADRATPDRLTELEQAGLGFDQELWADLAIADILGAALPAQLGGDGYGLAEQCSILVEIGRAVALAPYLESIVLGAGAIARFGMDEQLKRWAGPAAAGDLVLTGALSEAGSEDPRTPVTRADYVNGRWLLRGTKTTVPFGASAGLFLVPATTGPGVAVFCVEPADPGVSIAPQRLIDGAGAAELEFDSVGLDDDRLLGRPGSGSGSGAEVVDWLLARATVGLCALQLGVAERALELTAEYARNRQQFGRPIGAFQAVAQRLADAYIDVEAIRLTMWQAAWRLAAGLPCDAEIATAKFWAADAGHRVAHTAVHVHGGVGIDISHPLHRYFTAAKRNEFALGGATTQLRRLGAALAATG